MDQQDPNNKMNEKDIAKVFQEAAIKEAQAYQLFCDRFDQQFPAPERPNIKLMNAIGWQFITILIQSVASIILAALRTAHMFFEAAAAVNVVVRYLDAGVSVFAIEFGVVIFSAIKAEIENRKNTEEDLRAALNINVKLLWTGIIACVLISAVAGLGTSISGFGIDATWFEIVLTVVMGAGATIVAWVSGDILGAMVARLNNLRALAALEYQRENTERETKKNGMWEAAPERAIARTELVELKEWMAANRFKAEKQPRQKKVEPQPQEEPKTDSHTNGHGEVRQKVFDYLDRIWQEQGRVAGPSEIQRETGAAKSHCSQTLIPEWRATREIPTLEMPAEERVNGN